MNSERREVASRNTSWAQNVAQYLAQHNISPNTISIMSIVFSALSVVPLFMGYMFAPIIVIIGIVLRLLCNLFDGMVAVEHQRSSVIGPLFNEIPDRISDTIFFVAIGYYIAMPELGWACACIAVLTAYIRTLGASVTGQHYFNGPMAKQHRMAVLIAAFSIAQAFISHQHIILQVALYVCTIGSILTCVNRTTHIYHYLKNQPQ